MAGIIQPNRFRQQPQYAAPIDYSGLGRNVRFALIGGTAPVEVCKGIRPGGTLGTTEVTPAGIAFVSPVTSTTTWAAKVTDLDPFVSGSFSVFWYGLLRADTGQTLLQSSAARGWDVMTAGWAGGMLRLRLRSVFNGGAGFNSTAFACPDNSLHSVVVNYDSIAGMAEGFVDGVSVGSGAWGGDGGAIGASQAFIIDGHATLPHKMLTVQAFKGTLNSGEIAALTANPWRVFKAPQRRIWAVETTGGTSHDLIGASSTQANTSAEAGIAQSHVLTGSPASAANTGSTGAVTQTHALAGSAAGEANTSSAAGITQAHGLTVVPASEANTSSTAGITQAHGLTTADSAQANAGATVAISLGIAANLTGAASTQASTAHAAAVTQQHLLICAPSVQDSVAGASAIVQAHVLAAAAGVQVNGANAGAIVQPALLPPIPGPAGSGGRLRYRHDSRPRAGRDRRPRQ